MFRTTLKSLAARKLRLLLTTAAIVLGVTFVTGTLVLTDTSARLFEAQFGEATAGVDLIVRSAAEFDSAMGIEVDRDPVPASTLDTIRSVAGVDDAEGLIIGSAVLIVDGDAVVPGGRSIGVSWASEPYNPFRIDVGRSPVSPGEVVIDLATAKDRSVEVGARIAVSLQDGSHPMQVVGIATFGDAPGIPNTTVALFSAGYAQQLYDMGDAWSQIQIVTSSGSADGVRNTLSEELGSDFEVSTAQDIAKASAGAAQEQLLFLTSALLLLAGTALVVGAFMIANTFSIVVTQRTQEFATLRAVGARGRQVIVSVLLEAGLVGMAASAAGVLVGVGAALGLRVVARAFGVVIPAGPLTIEPVTLATGFLIGLVVTLGAAMMPARRAARIAPVVAMRDAAGTPRLSRRRLAVGIVAVVIAGGLLLAASRSSSTMWVGAAGLAMLTATAVLAPVFAGRLAHRLGLGFGSAMASQLARLNLRRDMKRTASTSTALAIGIAVVTLVAVVSSSIREAVGAGVDDVIIAELMIESARGEMLGGLSPEIYHRAGEVAGVQTVSRLRFGHWLHDGSTRALTGVDPQTLNEVVNLSMIEGSLDELADGKVVIAGDAAAALGIGIGDAIDMTFSRTGVQQFEVVGIYDASASWAVGTRYLITMDTFAQHFAEAVDATVFVKIEEGADVGEVKAALKVALSDFPTASVYDDAEAKSARTRMLDSFLGLVTVLVLLAVAIALLGITNSLALSIAERTREIGLLRAVGMSRQQIGWMVRAEATLTAMVGAITGLGLGLVLAAVAVPALSGSTTVGLTIPVGQLAIYLVVATLGGTLAGLIPARRAARVNVLAAIAT